MMLPSVAPDELYGAQLRADSASLARWCIAIMGSPPPALLGLELPECAASTVTLTAAQITLCGAAARPRGLLRMVERRGHDEVTTLGYAVPGLLVWHTRRDKDDESLTAVDPQRLAAEVQERWRSLRDTAPAPTGEPYSWAFRLDLVTAAMDDDASGPWVGLVGDASGLLDLVVEGAEPWPVTPDEADEQLVGLLRGCGCFDEP